VLGHVSCDGGGGGDYDGDNGSKGLRDSSALLPHVLCCATEWRDLKLAVCY
jgi:hypothetical protein